MEELLMLPMVHFAYYELSLKNILKETPPKHADFHQIISALMLLQRYEPIPVVPEKNEEKKKDAVSTSLENLGMFVFIFLIDYMIFFYFVKQMR